MRSTVGSGVLSGDFADRLCFRLCASKAEGSGSSLDQGTNSLHAVPCCQNKRSVFWDQESQRIGHWKRRSRWSGICQCLWPIYVYPSVAVSTTGLSNVDPRPCMGCEVRDG